MNGHRQIDLGNERTLTVNGERYLYHPLQAISTAGIGDLGHVPMSIKVLLENQLRHFQCEDVTVESLQALIDGREVDISFRPGRVLMQDLLAGPALADLVALRDAVATTGVDAETVNPIIPVDLVIDHSLSVDVSACAEAAERNLALDYQRNHERYAFFRWCQRAFQNFRVVPPGSGIVHQINLEYLANVVTRTRVAKGLLLAADTLVGTDSHTPMVNSLGVLGFGVGGIEAQAAMLGLPIIMQVPAVVGVEFQGRLREGVTSTDLVLTVARKLRSHGVVGKFVEFYGDGLDAISLADRATISNMAPEYGATCVYFPIDAVTIAYLRSTGRDTTAIDCVQAYARAQGLWRDINTAIPVFSQQLVISLDEVEPCLAGPRRPEERIPLDAMAAAFERDIKAIFGVKRSPDRGVNVPAINHRLTDGDVVIAAITSCTNTSNPMVMMAAGLLARNALAKGLRSKPWVKTSLAPGSQVVRDYLDAAGLSSSLDALGFHLVGFGCTTCGGFSGPLSPEISDAIDSGHLISAAVLSGNRNFEARIHPQARAGYLASPPLVVAYAIAGNVSFDFAHEPLGVDNEGKSVYLRDIWPSNAEIDEALTKAIHPDMYRARYEEIFDGDSRWQQIPAPHGSRFAWNEDSTYLRRPPYFDDLAVRAQAPQEIVDARLLALLGDSVTTDHISPSGAIANDSPAGMWLRARQVTPRDFNSYGSRRANHEVMIRGGFANIRLRNLLLPEREGGFTRHQPSNEIMTIFDAAERYRIDGVSLVIVAGRDYGAGSSRDWAAKATALLGVKAVIAESFERIHRSNLIGLGVLPLQLSDGRRCEDLNLDGSERISICGIADGLVARAQLSLRVHRSGVVDQVVPVFCRLDTARDVAYFQHGGILPFIFRQLIAAKGSC